MSAAPRCWAFVAFFVAGPAAAEEITFEEPTLVCSIRNEADRNAVKRFASTLYETRKAIGNNLLQAIDSFETSMSFASDFEAQPQYASKLLETALEEGVDAIAEKVGEKIPGVEYVVKGIRTVHEEAERAANAAASRDVGAWIQAQREVVANRMVGTESTSGGNLALDDASRIEEAILQQICPRIDDGTFAAAIEELLTADADLRAAGVPPVGRLQRALYESFIAASFVAFAAEARTPGTVRILWYVDVEGSPSDHTPGHYPLVWDEEHWTAEVVLPEPYGDRVATGLNRLGVSPVETRAIREVCFATDGIAGGGGTYCGGQNADGSERFAPNPPWADQMFRASEWREKTTSFRN